MSADWPNPKKLCIITQNQIVNRQIYQITNFKDYRFVDKISMPFYKEVISTNVKAIYEFNEIVFNKQVKKIDFEDPKLDYSQ